MDDENPVRRRHLLIAGTGRAGTSFLVRYLAELGLDTHLGRHRESPDGIRCECRPRGCTVSYPGY